MVKKKLPIGIQNIRQILTENYVYVDKTRHALKLIESYKYVFLSRPRRFGKSLFIDTLHEIFKGNKELFKGLYIYKSNYNFEQYPVIRISWGGDFSTQEATERQARDIMLANQENLGVKCFDQSPDICFKQLIREAYKQYGKPVVVLIDEYDKPILDNISRPDQAAQRREFLRGLYVQLKENDPYIRFAFLTGISKFSKASIFSGLNNLFDISLHQDYATICGYTQQDLETVFADQFSPDVDMDKVREWYNGYNFLGEHVYNPFDILQFIANNFKFSSYWWKSGTPFSLIQMMQNNNYYLPKLENMEISEVLLDSFDIERLKLEVLLFQAGYLTIDKQIHDDFSEQIIYKLRVPNKEVQISLNQLFYEYLTGQTYHLDNSLLKELYAGNIEILREKLTSLFASIPYNNYVNNTISSYEGYYASVVYAYLMGLGVRTIPEDVTVMGRIDLTLFLHEKVYIIEFKVGEGKNALEQIKKRKYWEKYQDQAQQIYLIGIEFDEQNRNIVKFEWETL